MSTARVDALEAGFALEHGFECSDMDSFYSSVTGGFGNRAGPAPDGDGVRVAMAHGVLRVRTNASNHRLLHEITVEQDAWVYDLVARWVLPRELGAVGEIGGELVPFGSLLYHEHAVAEARIGVTRIARLGAETLPPALRPVLYLRTENDRWIVHARAIAATGAQPFLKSTDGHAVPFSGSRVAARVLLRRRELAAPIYDTQIQPHVRLPRGLSVRVGLEVIS